MIDTHLRKYVEPSLTSCSKSLLKLRLTPDNVTFAAFFIGISSGYLIYRGEAVYGLIALWFSGFLDAIDGTMARLSKTSPFGTILDVGFDRLVEASVILGLAYKNPQHMGILLILTISILYGITVFLTIGAAVQNSGLKSFHYAVGIAERTEGFIFLTFMVVFQEKLFAMTLIFTVVEVVSTILRLVEAKRQLRPSGEKNEKI